MGLFDPEMIGIEYALNFSVLSITTRVFHRNINESYEENSLRTLHKGLSSMLHPTALFIKI